MTAIRDTAASARQRGFTLIEVVVATLITIEVILAALALFDFHNRLARVQGQITDMQQSLRVAQYEMVKLTREAGRGGLPAVVQSGAYGAVGVRNNVTSGSDQVAIGFSGTPKAVDGTDILVVRGAFSLPVFTLDPSGPGKLVLTGGTGTPATATSGSLIVCAVTPTNIAQDITPLISAVSAAGAAGQVEPLVLVGSRSDGDYAVVELNPASSVLNANQPTCPASTANPNGVKIAFTITGDVNANAFQQLGAVTGTTGLPPLMNAAATLGVLEEYRYYIRQDAALNGFGDPVRHLSRARMYPGTETPYFNNSTNLQVDVADNLLELQIALGVDNNGDGLITEGGAGIPPSTLPPTTTDEWLYNVAGDPTFPVASPLREVRINTIAITGNPDPAYQGPKLTQVEDHAYLTTDFPNTFHGRCYRHRLLTTVVGLRNL
ncbi:MAG TPA: prepilin-type N-terminal cleavage/methylation domain-containing protein [Thermoanaerobaculia bacterium]|nr:prepilin-type N-terminal cleavage/methylation domain-containing protein [Thermoanaerobaculia bacterium]